MKKLRIIANIGLLVISVFVTLYLIYSVFTSNIVLTVRHYLSIIFLLILILFLFINKNTFILILGVYLLIGNFAGLSSFADITINFWAFNIGSLPIPLYWGQPPYSIMLLIYLIFNKEFYIGILTKEYWKGFANRTYDFERKIEIIKLGRQENSTQNTKE